MTEFKIRNKELVQEYLLEVLKLFNSEGHVEGSNKFLFDNYVYAIQYHITDFPRWMNNSEISGILIKALFKLPNCQENNLLENFKEELRSQIDSLSKLPLDKYYLIIPTNFEISGVNIDYFNILDKKILIRSYSRIKKQFDITNENLIRDIQLHSQIKQLNDNHAFLIIEDNANNKYRFAEKAEETYELFRSIINFIDRYKRTPFVMWPRKPLSLFKESPLLLIFNEDKQYLYLVFKSKPVEEKGIKIDFNSKGNLVKQYRKISRMLNGIKDDKIKNKILLAFKLHNYSLDNYDQDWLFCFYQWQILEILFTTKSSEKYEIISKRIVALIGDNKPFYDVIRNFMEKRHLLIHQAKYEIFSETDCNTMKEMIEFLIVRILGLTRKIKNFRDYEFFLESIDFYFMNMNINDSDLGSHLRKKKEISRLFEKSSLFKDDN